QSLYGTIGHIFCQVAPEENLDPIKQVADVTLKIQEGETAFVGKLEFAGNTFTKDYVIRREWLLREGARFNTGWLKACITRMRQLGLVDIAKDPEFKPNPQDPKKMDIKVHVKELNRQSVNFNLGYSGFDGLYLGLGYSTRNFLGTGETLAVTIQTGTRSKQYKLAFSEPYLFHSRANVGFEGHKSSLSYPGSYTRKGEGFSISTSTRLPRFFNLSLSYSYEDVEISDLPANFLDDPLSNLYFRDGAISAISPVFYYSTVDSPLFPSSGSKFLLSYRYSGGILGGDVDLH
ncbi:MAG: BamA/TamA family outer membrane protein, partial [bacterium]|nr:BamA/TamA family outer membrane protein [bacterium]